MFGRRVLTRGMGVALICAATVAVGAAGPAAAASSAGSTPPADYGSSVKCKYHTNENTQWSFTAKFRKIVVAPPQMFATSGTQTVGWRFSVQRGISKYADPPTSWTVTYTSPTQKRSATKTRAAAFDSMTVGVVVPTGDWNPAEVQYMVTLQMFRYAANGSVKSKTTYLMPTYNEYVNGEFFDNYDSNCPGVVKQYVDGPFGDA